MLQEIIFNLVTRKDIVCKENNNNSAEYEVKRRNKKYFIRDKYTNSYGSTYEGDLMDGKEHGHGTFCWKDGTKYEGEWRFGKKHGYGRLTLADGTEYIGKWKEGKRTGLGTMTYSDGEKWFGYWKNGKLSKGTKYNKNGKIFASIINRKEIKLNRDL
tara:strand:+ start:138 stop:608 length:471 start_codon:yes stop_codon:yes gene_type:complete